MRTIRFLWILFGLLVVFTFPARAEFSLDKITMKVGSTEGEATQKDFYGYSDWKFKYFKLDLTNKFSWPKNNENFSKFNLKADLGKFKQLDLDLDYQWNERYRILGPEIAYDFKFKPGLTIGLEYENENRNPVLDKDQKFKYHMDIGTVKMALDKKKWVYGLKLAHARKEYPKDEVKNYTRNQLNHDFSWRIQPDLKFKFTYYETTRFYPNDLKISQDYWSSEVGISGDYRFNDQWQMIGSLRVKEAERGLIPYLDQQNWEFKLKNKLNRDVTIDLRISSGEFDYYSDITYFDPDEFGVAEEDQKSRMENKAAVECYWRFKELNLEFEAGLFWVFRDYSSALIADLQREGIYTSLSWKPNNIGIELVIAPDGNLWRVNGFYQLKFEYYF